MSYRRDAVTDIAAAAELLERAALALVRCRDPVDRERGRHLYDQADDYRHLAHLIAQRAPDPAPITHPADLAARADQLAADARARKGTTS